MGCNCGGSRRVPVATQNPRDARRADHQNPVPVANLNDPSLYWTGPPRPPQPEPQKR